MPCSEAAIASVLQFTPPDGWSLRLLAIHPIDMRFDFIHEAMKEVAYPRFFHTQPLTDLERKRLDALSQLPPSYVEFLNTFGRARFFRDLDREKHLLSVFPPPEKMHFYDDSYMLDAGATDSTSVFFKLSELAGGNEPPLYHVVSGPRRCADSFAEWLTRAWKRCRRRYSKNAWARVLAGPEAFSPEEQRLVDVRRSFSWRQLPPHHGMIAIEFTNASNGFLSRYTIGVKDSSGLRMVGGFFVDVAHIAPGTTAVVHVPLGGYSHLLTAETSVLFDKGEPRPESRGDFWEFRAIQNEVS